MAYKPQVLEVAAGDTGRATLTNHGVVVGAATTGVSATAAGSAGQVLQSGGASADPAYSTATYPSTSGTSGNLLQSDGTNWVSSTGITEGSFTPVLGNTGSAPTVTYATNGQVGRYIRIGNLVTFTIRIILTAYTAGTGNVQITGLPFTSRNATNESWGFTMRMQNVTYGASVLWYSANVGVNSTTISINGNRSANTLLALAAAGPSATTDISITGTYVTS